MERDQGHALEPPQERGDPDAADARRRNQDQRQVTPGNPRARHVGPGREDQPDQVNQMHRQDQHRDPEQQPRLALALAEQQDEERQEEMEADQEQGDPLPAAVRPAEVPRRLLRQAARPDDQELGEGHVSPEHDERQQEVAQVVEPAGGHGVGHGPVGRQDAGDHDHQGQRGQGFAGHEHGPVNGGRPSGLERHPPVDRRERAGQEEDHEPRAAQCLQSAAGGRVDVLVLGPRPAAEHRRERGPDDEVERRAAEEERHVQVRRLVREFRVQPDLLGAGPAIQGRQVRAPGGGRGRPSAGPWRPPPPSACGSAVPTGPRPGGAASSARCSRA